VEYEADVHQSSGGDRLTQRRDDLRTDGIHIGHGRRPAISLASGGPEGTPIDIKAPAEPETVTTDWERIRRSLRLSLLQEHVFIRHWQHGISLKKLPAALGIPPPRAPRNVGSAQCKSPVSGFQYFGTFFDPLLARAFIKRGDDGGVSQYRRMR
jgi:hypothetical protein